jgi:hypothetical protein
MFRTRTIAALLITAAVVAACGADATSPAPASHAAVGQASPSTEVVASADPSTPPSSAPSGTPAATPAATPTPTAAPTAAPTPVPTPVPWKAYKSKRNHYTIKYPPTWIVTPGSAKIADQFDAYGYPYVYISRDTVSTSVSVSLTVTHDIAFNKSHYKAKLKSNKAIRLHGYSGRILVFEGTDNGLKVRIEQIIIAKGKVGYFLSLFADRTTAVADHATFKKMYQSWKPT